MLTAASLGAGQPVFKARTDAVRVDVLVEDKGRLIRGLTAKDFELRDNGVVQTIGLVEVEQLPLNLICALDASGSVAGELLEKLTTAARALVDALRPNDQVALLSFASRVRLLSPLTLDRPAIRAAIGDIDAGGRTSLRDAVFAALVLRDAHPQRTLVLVFSDDRDTASWLPSAKVIEVAKRTDAVVYAVSVAELTAWKGEHRRVLEELAAETGGRVVRAGRRGNLTPVFRDILGEFRSRYVLSYEPSGVPRGGWHDVKVALPGRAGTVTARRGYFAEEGQ